ncbi:MAG: hypothetical protein DI539_15915 [Flavobacterium psychrophilum]|nr:MAG: hypothetical protein DI539_15915 [Flavobacterium psychrophilum]
MPNVIIILGDVNAGKTTTCSYLYTDLLNNPSTPPAHIFNGVSVTAPSLKYKRGGAVRDFSAVLKYNGKEVAIISAGDKWGDLEKQIKVLSIHDVLVVCARTKRTKTYKNLFKIYGTNIVHEEPIVRQATHAKSLKQGYINNIIAHI